MQTHDPAIVDWLAAVVRGDQAAADPAWDRAAIVAAAVDHGVLPWLREREQPAAAEPGSPDDDVVLDLLREGELKRAFADLERAGVHPLIIKGGQLAYTHYPRPELRPRIDTDILIPASARQPLDDTLRALGYEKKGGMTGDLVSSQSMYVKRLDAAAISALDVHWRIANAQVFAGVLDYDELQATSAPIPALGSGARGLSNVHALMLACVHRVAHHLDSERLIWLYDIHLLGGVLSDAEWRAFADLAVARQMVGVCQRSLRRTVDRFGTAVPAWVWSHAGWGAGRAPELSANYLTPRRNISVMTDDFRALPTWRARWSLAREHLFPPAHYMRTVFAPSSRAPLLWLHARRLVRGARKWLATPTSAARRDTP